MTNYDSESGYEYVLDNRKLIFSFVALMAFCCCFFVAGFVLGKRHGLEDASQAAAEAQPKVSSEMAQPQSVKAAQPDEQPKVTKQNSADQPLDWYKNVSSHDAAPAKIQPAPVVDATPKPATPKHETPPPPEKPKPQASAQTVTYCLQVGAFSQKQALDATAQLLRNKGFDYTIEPPQAEGQLYRLIVGKYHTRAEAAAMKLRLQKNGFSSFIKANTAE